VVLASSARDKSPTSGAAAIAKRALAATACMATGSLPRPAWVCSDTAVLTAVSAPQARALAAVICWPLTGDRAACRWWAQQCPHSNGDGDQCDHKGSWCDPARQRPRC